MDLKKSKWARLKTAIVALGCLSGASAGSYILYLDFNRVGGAGQGAPMAKVERREAKVRRKPSSSYVWSNVEPNQDLYRKDSIQTGPGSAAAIRLSDGSILELGEESLVVIDDIQNLSLNFVRGSMVVRSKKGDSRVTVGKDGKAKVEELPVRLIKPEPLSEYFTPANSTKAVTFRWEAMSNKAPDPNQPAPEGSTIQISSDKLFRSERTKTQAVPGSSNWQLSAQFPPGRYFWRVIGKNKEPLTEARQFRILSAGTLKPIFPNATQKIVTWREDTTVQFRWVPQSTVDAGASSDSARVEHRIEVSKSPDFQDLIVNESIAPTTGVAKLRGVFDGELYWRIRSSYTELVVNSDVQKFVIEKGKKLAVDLAVPKDGSAFEVLPEVRFSWDSDASSEVEYQWELQSVSGGESKSVLSSKSRAPVYTWKDAESGQYRWRVLALLQGEVAGESQWRKFSIFKGKPLQLKAPSNDQAIFYWDDPIPISFEWEEDSLLDQEGFSYQLELAKDVEFRNGLKSTRSTDNRIRSDKLNLPAGSYFWRVKVVDKSGQLVKTSQVARFNYGVYPPLPAPRETGKPIATFNPLEQEKFPEAMWNPVEGAEGYEVNVYHERSLGRSPASGNIVTGKPTFTTVTTRPSVELKNLEEGSYFWTVKAIDRLKRRGEPMKMRGFTITYGEPLAAPEPVSPEVQ